LADNYQIANFQLINIKMAFVETLRKESISSKHSSDGEDDLFDFYCPTCLLSFADDQGFREHYKSEIHKYNSKRKIAGLQAVTTEQFDERRNSNKNSLPKKSKTPNSPRLEGEN